MILRADARMRIGPTRRSVLALIGSLAPAAAFAAYPERPIKLVVALAPGGPADTAARLFAPYFSERLGQSVVIENRTGASSVVGTESVVRAPPDGYTLLFGSSFELRGQSSGDEEPALRRAQGTATRGPSLVYAACARGARCAPRKYPRRAHRARQGAAGQ